MLRGAASFEQEGGTGAIAEIRQGIDASQAIGSNLTVPYWLVLLADAYRQNGQAEEGLVAIAEAFDEVARTEERFSEAELYRVKGRPPPRTRCNERIGGRILLSQGHRNCSLSEGKVLGAARRDHAGSAVV